MGDKIRFGCDVDGVFYPWDKIARQLLNSHFGPIISNEPSSHWNEIQESIEPHQWDWLWDKKGGLYRLFSIGEPDRFAITALEHIREIAHIVLLTSVPPDAASFRARWLWEWNIPFDELHISTHPKHLVQPFCDVYLDDGPHNIVDLSNNTPGLVLVWDCPYNQDIVESHRVYRTSSWADVVFHLMSRVHMNRIEKEFSDGRKQGLDRSHGHARESETVEPVVLQGTH